MYQVCFLVKMCPMGRGLPLCFAALQALEEKERRDADAAEEAERSPYSSKRPLPADVVV